jgi:signal transduction histidine kinase
LRVVVADDSSAIRLLARNALARRRGFTVVGEASDGSEALRLVKQHEPDCVVLDVEMPGMGGFEALAELKRSYPAVPVVMLSGFSNETVVDRAMAGGASALLHKDQLTRLAETVRDATASPIQVPVWGPNASPGAVTQPAPIAPSRPSTAIEDLRRFEYVVSHDFAEPLRAMTGFAKLLETQYAASFDDTGVLFLEHINAAAARMRAMVDDLLAYSRAGRSELTRQRVILNEVANAVRAGLPAQIDDHRTSVVVDDLPDVVGDRDMCLTVLRHLMLNGLTFNRSIEPTVRVLGHTTGDTAVITVSDNGIGIEAVQHDKVFELFRRLNTRDEYPGTGTGLALSRRIVAIQGGTLELYNSSNSGSAFQLTLPRYDEQQGV